MKRLLQKIDPYDAQELSAMKAATPRVHTWMKEVSDVIAAMVRVVLCLALAVYLWGAAKGEGLIWFSAFRLSAIGISVLNAALMFFVFRYLYLRVFYLINTVLSVAEVLASHRYRFVSSLLEFVIFLPVLLFCFFLIAIFLSLFLGISQLIPILHDFG